MVAFFFIISRLNATGFFIRIRSSSFIDIFFQQFLSKGLSCLEVEPDSHEGQEQEAENLRA
jgi:hypothetical protein